MIVVTRQLLWRSPPEAPHRGSHSVAVKLEGTQGHVLPFFHIFSLEFPVFFVRCWWCIHVKRQLQVTAKYVMWPEDVTRDSCLSMFIFSSPLSFMSSICPYSTRSIKYSGAYCRASEHLADLVLSSNDTTNDKSQIPHIPHADIFPFQSQIFRSQTIGLPYGHLGVMVGLYGAVLLLISTSKSWVAIWARWWCGACMGSLSHYPFQFIVGGYPHI